MKKFYALFPNPNALSSQLTWTHYRILLRVEDEAARSWYMDECIQSAWSSRQLERQILTLYNITLWKIIIEPWKRARGWRSKKFNKAACRRFYKRSLCSWLKNYPALRESDLEQALIGKLQEFLLELGRFFVSLLVRSSCAMRMKIFIST